MATCILAILPAASGASSRKGDGAYGVHGMTERQLRAAETELLGPAHAAEHARERALRREPPHGPHGHPDRPHGDPTGSPGGGPAPPGVPDPVPGLPSSIGSWAQPFSIPVIAIHAALLPTGKIMWFAYPNGLKTSNTSTAWLWDPATGVTKRVDPPLTTDPHDGRLKPANIWCAGQALLHDGRLLVVGGNLDYQRDGHTWMGLNKIFTFNPWTETWTEQPNMRHGRWYPSVSVLPDGRAAIMSGYDESGVGPSNFNRDIELFTPSPDLDGQGTVSLIGDFSTPGSPPLPGLYPHMFGLPSGRTLVAGPNRPDSWYFNVNSAGDAFTWQQAPDLARIHLWGTGVLIPGGTAGSNRVMVIGGSYYYPNPSAPSFTMTEYFDENGTAWKAGSPLSVARAHHNTVLLPDGSMVTIGGGTGNNNGNQYGAIPNNRIVELWTSATAWRRGAAQAEYRTYHSTALLLPDGRVISAGDDMNGGIDRDTAEIFSPPYLFNGARPTISSAPTSIGYGQTFGVGTPSANVTRAALVAPGATTHANDMSQRVVALSVTQGTGSVNLTAPANENIAPPGHYMLFLLNSSGVPSVAKWVQLAP